MKHRLMLYAPANPERMNPGNWYTVVNGQQVWNGPLSGPAWLKAYGNQPGKKPAPAYNDCIFLKRSVHQDICAAVMYEPCKKCRIPRMYTGVRLVVPSRIKKALLNMLKRTS